MVMEMSAQPATAADPIRAFIRAAQQQSALLADIQEAWRNPSPQISPVCIGNAGPPTELLVRRVHYKPLVRGRLVLEMSGESMAREGSQEGGRIFLAMQIYPQLEQARERFQKLAEEKLQRTPGPPIFFLPSFQAVATCLPNSPRLVERRWTSHRLPLPVH
jgi:hypothetical protein